MDEDAYMPPHVCGSPCLREKEGWLVCWVTGCRVEPVDTVALMRVAGTRRPALQETAFADRCVTLPLPLPTPRPVLG